MACENNTVNRIVEILDSKTAEDITVLNVTALTTITDYFVIATGRNERLTQALCDNVEDELSKDGLEPVNKEGYRSGDWILVAYNDVIIHIFKPEAREFYDLERVWQDAVSVDVSDLLK